MNSVRAVPNRRNAKPRGFSSVDFFRQVLFALVGISSLLTSCGATSPPEVRADEKLELTLAEAVTRALSTNPNLVSVRLRRVLEKYDLEQAEEWFHPRLSFGTLSARRSIYGVANEQSWNVAAGPRVDMRLPTGGSVSLMPGWTASTDSDRRRWDERVDLMFGIRQPLLRGGGLDVGLARVRLARLSEETNILQFKAAVMNVVEGVSRAYRALIESEVQVQINLRSLERAEATLEVNRLLVETGRMANLDVTQTEADVARRELGVVESQIRVDDARRDLNVLLDLDGSVLVVPTEPLQVEPVAVNLDRSRALARENRIDYLQALIGVRRSEIGLMLARNDARWDLSLDASATYAQTDDGIDDLQTGGEDSYLVALSLSIPISGDESRRIRRQRLAADLSMREAENALASATREMDTAVRNAVRAVDTGIRRMELARAALELAEEKLELEQGKLALGMSSNFQVAQYETDLLNAQLDELRSRIDYLEAVTGHDRTVGTLLETWGIDIGSLPESSGASE